MINPRRSLKARLGLAIGSVALILSVLVSLSVGYTARGQMEANVGQSLAELAYQMADKLDRGMFERYRDIQILTSLELLQNPATSVAAKRELLEKLQITYQYYAWIGLTDTQGKVLVSTNRVLEGKDVRARPWFQKAQTDIYVGDVHPAVLLAKILPNPTGEPLRLIDVAAPVRDRTGNFKGVLGAHLSWKWAREVQESLLRTIEKHRAVEILILAQDGTVLLGPPELESQQLTLESVRAARTGENSHMLETWSNGKSYLTGFAQSQGYRNYPGLGWLVMVRQRSHLAFALAQKLQHQIFLITMTLGILLAILGWLIADAMAQPLLEIAAAADRIRHGHLNSKIPAFGGKDEIAILSRSLNELVLSLMRQEQELQASNHQLQSELQERQQTQKALKQSEERFRIAARCASDLIYEWNISSGSLEWFGNIDEQLGYNVGEFPRTQTAWENIIHPHDRDRVRAAVVWHLKTRQPYFEEYRVQRQDGTWLYWTDRGTALGDENGNSYKWIGVNTDITARKQTEQALREALQKLKELNASLEHRVAERTAQLEAANQELEAFSYSVSHDLRAPLRSIDGFSVALLERYDSHLDDKGKHYLQRVRAATQKMGELIDDLLKLSRVTRSEMVYQAVDLSAMVQTIALDLRQMQPERQVDLIVASGVVTQGDPKLLMVVLENLLNNAWKFTSKAVYAKIEFGTLSRTDGTTAYFISDNGAGFNMAYGKKLFEAFGRLHNADEFPGTGVGLATVKRIVQRHGGQVWAEGAVGQGARFYFTLY